MNNLPTEIVQEITKMSQTPTMNILFYETHTQAEYNRETDEWSRDFITTLKCHIYRINNSIEIIQYKWNQESNKFDASDPMPILSANAIVGFITDLTTAFFTPEDDSLYFVMYAGRKNIVPEIKNKSLKEIYSKAIILKHDLYGIVETEDEDEYTNHYTKYAQRIWNILN